MVKNPPLGNLCFRMVAKGLVELHRFDKAGKDESPEAESIRDALDAPLDGLTQAEKERAQWLSEDLYSVSEPTPGVLLQPMDAQAQQDLNVAIEARQAREWDRALLLLRRRKDYIAPALLSYLRGRIWSEAGYPEVAAMFYGHASEMEPNDPAYAAIYMHTLALTDPEKARELASEVLAADEKYAPAVVSCAAGIKLDEARTVSLDESARVQREMVPILERILARIEGTEEASTPTSIYIMTVGLLGSCHEFLERLTEAEVYYSRGLSKDPNNEGLLVARGILRYGKRPEAIPDLEQAIKVGSCLVWPYLLLAHHYLLKAQFEECRNMCESGLRTNQGSEAAKSQLEEWRAIALAELGVSAEQVRAGFEAAIRLNPANDLAAQNYKAFEEFHASQAIRQERWWKGKTEAAIRQLGLLESRPSFVLEHKFSFAA